MGLTAALLAVVFTVNVTVEAPEPLIVAEAGMEQVGAAVDEPVTTATLQLKLTSPVNPPEGVTDIVEVPLPPALPMVIAPLLLSWKPAALAIPLFTTGASIASRSRLLMVTPPHVSPSSSLLHW